MDDDCAIESERANFLDWRTLGRTIKIKSGRELFEGIPFAIKKANTILEKKSDQYQRSFPRLSIEEINALATL